MNSPPKISDLAVNLTLTARRSLPQTHAEIEVLLFDVVVSHWGIGTSAMVAPGILRYLCFLHAAHLSPLARDSLICDGDLKRTIPADD
ncbi:hypothetical protein R3I94_022741 [Phoxinus phoxinus]